ncbi:hypothetical protein QNI16_27785 [Cytophagaceae bacterium YF14B1]|uniref:Uncharacterized protein n=1 Tax=Xanthocytophaga flava TaxID=3048013 RepID=A0AAE3QW13_9BACT|nr:hypothetical protein [Xanthocytophaga flavus]MDJ1484330.1 hypothetical protein [Xanthocytophaga flavus]
MTNNRDLSERTFLSIAWRLRLFSLIWIIGILIIIFRIDVILLESHNSLLDLIKGSLPIAIILLAIVLITTQKWYFTLLLLFYPIAFFCWFLPKTILKNGKIYLLGHYLNLIFKCFRNFKKTLIHFSLFVFSILILVIIGETWTRWVIIGVMSYFYFRYSFTYTLKAFKPAQLFGSDLESFLEKNSGIKSGLINALVNVKQEESLPEIERKEKQLTRLVLTNYLFLLISQNLNGFRGKRAFIISVVFEIAYFVFVSICFFWLVNYQLYKIESSNFIIDGLSNPFEFLYYTFKTTLSFGDIEAIKPYSKLAKSVEMISYMVLGIVVLVFFASMIFSLRQEKIFENVKLVTEICSYQNAKIDEVIKKEFGIDIEKALKEFATINESVENLKNIFRNVF